MRKNDGSITKKWYIAKLPVLKFFGIFVGVIVMYYLFVAFADFGIMDFYVNMSANLAGWIMGMFGRSVQVINGIICSDKVAVALSFGCEGSEPIVIFCAGVLAFPSKWRDKWLGLGGGIVLLYLMNLIRIIGLYFILEGSPEQFESFHTLIFPVIFIFIAVICWGLWIKWTTPKKA
jgi:exosortase/archaeosortase family protein